MGKRILGVSLILLAAAAAVAKDKPLAAIVLYRGDRGPSYVQLSEFSINARRELYVCAGQPLDNNAYKRLGKTTLAPGLVLERDPKGALILTSVSGPTCVVPVNLKLEKNRTYELKMLVDMGVMAGAPISKSSNEGGKIPVNIPAIARIHLLEAPDAELAEYLRADWAQTISLWNDYLKLYPSGPHAAQARKNLAGLLVAQGAKQLETYRQSVSANNPDYEQLKQAVSSAEQARQALPGFPAADQLRSKLDAHLQAILATGAGELNLFLKAMAEHAPGYAHLEKAWAQVQHVTDADPSFSAVAKLKADVTTQQQTLEATLKLAESQARERKFDQAYAAVLPYKQFSGELPRVSAVIEAAFKYRRDRGRAAVNEGRWGEAISEFRRALEYRDDPETKAALEKAAATSESLSNTQAAQTALENSRALAGRKQYVEAYGALESLPEAQRSLVAGEMEGLKPDYLKDLVKRAADLLRVHQPIRGRADEKGVRQAYEYLSRATKLSDEGMIKVKLDLISDKLTEYYLGEASRVLDKPRGSGIGLGFLFLQEAQIFKPENNDTRNQMTKYAPEFESHAKLSLGLRFRDQTARRESVSFADALAEALASGLESSGLPGLKVMSLQQRSLEPDADTGAGPFIANYLVNGSILQHRIDRQIETQPQTSHYRAGHREVKNPDWLEVKRQVDALQDEYNRLRELPAAKNKKEGEQRKAALDEQLKKLTDARRKLDEVPETKAEEVIQPYNYLRRTINLKAIVEVTYRLSDFNAHLPGALETVRVEVPASATMLENVKPEDVDGVVEQGTPPDEEKLMNDARSQAEDKLIKKVVRQLGTLPPKILEEARAAAANSDPEGAAEKYVLYLNSTPAKDSPERQEAQSFLKKEFHISSGIVR